MCAYWPDRVIISEYNPIALTIHIENEKGCHHHTFLFFMKLYSRIALKKISTNWLICLNGFIEFVLSNFVDRDCNYCYESGADYWEKSPLLCTCSRFSKIFWGFVFIIYPMGKLEKINETETNQRNYKISTVPCY